MAKANRCPNCGLWQRASATECYSCHADINQGAAKQDTGTVPVYKRYVPSVVDNRQELARWRRLYGHDSKQVKTFETELAIYESYKQQGKLKEYVENCMERVKEFKIGEKAFN